MMTVEICIDDLAGAHAAEIGGATRVEVCANLGEGGVTPSIGLIESIVATVTKLDVQIMIRPRGGDFVYSADEISVMKADIVAVKTLARSSSARLGVVLGVLKDNSTVDAAVMLELLEAAEELPVTFHKAFDDTPNLPVALETLIELGVIRVLTSGGEATAAKGSAVLKDLVTMAPETFAILAGGGVRPANVAHLVKQTGVREVHLRAQRIGSRGDNGLVTDVAIVRAMTNALHIEMGQA
jgi:copper homeostasis protein CutC